MLLVAIIFLYFIYQTSTIELSLDFSIEALKKLYWSFFNILLLFVAVGLYWIIKEKIRIIIDEILCGFAKSNY